MADETFVVDERLLNLCRQYQVASLKVFGSVARGEEREDSDIDLLVQFVRPVSLLTLVRLERELSALIGRKVDLVTEQAISPYIRDAVLASARGIYESS
ncbi:nucleotidyltransferase [Candidatus Parcubacteria bacterium]|nr:MAG: nucleotidyltransferase [Candidatus Parcubacteria bacterium]